MRILLFLATNLAVILVASFTLRLLGVDSYLAQNGIQYGSSDIQTNGQVEHQGPVY